MKHGLFFLLGAATVLASCRETRIHEKKEWGKYFEQHNITSGCFIMQDQVHETIYYYNKERCLEQYLPASTFKIFNALVALETNVAPDESLVISWDGITRDENWNRDMNMREAFRTSNVPYYQELARRIGYDRMSHYLDTIKYGNMVLKSGIDTFWLDNTLRISADEQLGFVKRLYFNELKGVSERSQRIVKSMMLRDEQEKQRIYYKTGWGKSGERDVLWVVGFAERIMKVKEHKESMNKSDVRIIPYFFAQNFEIPAGDTTRDWAQVRTDILYNILRDFGAIQ